MFFHGTEFLFPPGLSLRQSFSYQSSLQFPMNTILSREIVQQDKTISYVLQQMWAMANPPLVRLHPHREISFGDLQSLEQVDSTVRTIYTLRVICYIVRGKTFISRLLFIGHPQQKPLTMREEERKKELKHHSFTLSLHPVLPDPTPV